jgi:4-alpha-glucanotransferase
VHALRDAFRMPGMKVLQFAFGPDEGESDHQPHTYNRRAIVYTGTHDNETTVGWWNELGRRAESGHDDARKTRAFVLRYLGAEGREIHWDLLRAAMASVANQAIVPLQDLLGLDGSARMNLPGTTHPRNWTWRFDEGAIGDPLRDRLFELTRTYARERGRHRG